MMTDWHQKAIDALQLKGLGERTQDAYVRSLRMLCEFYDTTPDPVSDAQLRQYFLQRKNFDGWSPAAMRICYCGIRHFFVHVLRRDWHTLELVRAQSERRLPAVLSVAEAHSILGCVRTGHNRAFLATVYACGLRLQDAQHLEVFSKLGTYKLGTDHIFRCWCPRMKLQGVCGAAPVSLA